jgi:hypothetical protein
VWAVYRRYVSQRLGYSIAGAMMRSSGTLLLAVALSCSILTQEALNLKPETMCGFSGEVSVIPGDLRRFPPDAETRAAVDKIMKYTSLTINFELVAANVPNAEAGMDGNERIIAYNQSFMREIARQTGTNWAATSILAHEIGHHLNQHTFGKGGDRPAQELAADQFSGGILFKMGATLEEAQAAIEAIPETTVPYYPKKSARKAAVANGWIAAQALAVSGPNPAVSPPPKPVGVSGTWSGEYTLLPDKGSRPTYIVFELTQNGATVEGEMTLTNEAAENGQTSRVRGTYQENGDFDLTALPNSRDPVTLHFNGHLANGANSVSGKVVAADTRYQGNAQKKLTFPGTFSITRSPE